MEMTALVKARYSLRSYDPARGVDRSHLYTLLNTARLAPSARNQQPWHILVVESPAARAAVCRAYPRDWLKNAPVILVVKGKRSQAWNRESDGYNSLETDLTILMDHLILTATDLGLGTCWIANFDPVALQGALDLPEDETVFALTPLGYPPEGHQAPEVKPRKTLEEMSTFL